MTIYRRCSGKRGSGASTITAEPAGWNAITFDIHCAKTQPESSLRNAATLATAYLNREQ
jgi:hypothetical protein